MPEHRGKSRYSNIKRHTAVDGTVLDSKRELRRYGELLLLEKAGMIAKLAVHPRYPIVICGVQVKIRSGGYPNGRVVTYVADFKYLDLEQGLSVIEDVKMQSGHRTEVYKLKKALMEAMGYEIKEY